MVYVCIYAAVVVVVTAVVVLCLYVECPGLYESPGPSDGHGGGGYLSHLVRRTGAVVAWWVVVTWSVEWERMRRWWVVVGGGGWVGSVTWSVGRARWYRVVSHLVCRTRTVVSGTESDSPGPSDGHGDGGLGGWGEGT